MTNKSRVSIVRCANYKQPEVEDAVKMAIGLLGGIEKFVRPNSKVLLKPNLLSARTPEEGVDTHPEVVRQVARLIKTVTPHIFVGDSPGGWELKDVDQVYEKSGVRKVCLEEGLQLVRFDKAVDLDGFPIAAVAKEVDAIISVPKFKTHMVTMLTGAVKNTFGMVTGPHKAQCHLKASSVDEFADILVRVHALVKPALSIMDGIVGMEGEGPAAGALRNIGLIIASGDAVALDAVMSKLAGINPDEIATTKAAVDKKLGTADLDKIDVLGARLEEVKINNFKLPKTSILRRLPRPLVHFGLNRIKFYPHINKKACKGCGLCFQICPKNAVRKLKNGVYEVNTKECINCFCCHEVCLHNSITLKKSLLAKVLIR